jgi:hypothetical protein
VAGFFGGLLVFAVVLTVIALVGHFLFISAVRLSGLFGRRTKDKRALCCPGCGAVLVLADGRCATCRCRVQIHPSVAPQTDVWQSFVARLRRLWDKGILTEDDFRRILTAARVDHEEQEARIISGREPRVAPAAAPSPTGPVPQPVFSPKPAGGPSPAIDAFLDRNRAGPAADLASPAIENSPPAPPRTADNSIFEQDSVTLPAAVAAARPAGVVPASRAAPPSRPLSDLMRAFMDENNIRWGELISGLLIVGSAIGLVISLWATLRDAIPYFPALVFMLVTAAIHGAGMYTLDRWNLKSTSRGLLIIALFLIPLNYLAAVALSIGPNQQPRPFSDPLFLVAMGTGLLVFGTMSYYAGRRLLLFGSSLLPVGLLGASVGQVWISRDAQPGMSAAQATLLFLLPLISFVIAAGGHLALMARWNRLTPRRTVQLFLVTAVTLFALLTSAGLMCWKCDSVRQTLSNLAPALSLTGALVAACGGFVQNRHTRRERGVWRTAGTSVAFGGAAVMLLCTLLAWPQPELLVAIGIIDFIALTALALVLNLAPLHVPALVAAALSVVIGWNLFAGHLSAGTGSSNTLVAALLRGNSGLLLVGLAALAASASAVWRRVSRIEESIAYLQGAGGLAMLSAVVALHAGFWSGADRDLATIVLAIDAVALLLADFRWCKTPAAVAGSFLMLAALVHALDYNATIRDLLTSWNLLPHLPKVSALLLHATTMTVLAGLHRYRSRRAGELESSAAARPPAAPTRVSASLSTYCNTALLTSGLVGPLVIFGVRETLARRSEYGFWIAAVWLAVAIVQNSAPWFAAGQGMATWALALGVTAICRRLDWWDGNIWRPYHLQAQLGAQAIWSALWIAARRLTSSRCSWNTLVVSGWTWVDRVVPGGVAIGVTLLASLGCAPEIGAELATPGRWGAPEGWFFVLILAALAFGLCFTYGLTTRETGNTAALTLAVFVLTAALTILDWSVLGRGWQTLTASSLSDTFSLTGWLVAAVVAASLLTALFERVTVWALCGLLLCSFSVPLLIAGAFASQTAVATALRWSLALHSAAVALIFWNRDRIAVGAAKWISRDVEHVSSVSANVIDSTAPDQSSTRLASEALRPIAVALTLIPLISLTLRSAAIAAVRATATAPPAGAWLRSIPIEWSLAGPVLLFAAVLCGYAWRERLGAYALAASLAVQFAVGCAVAGRAGALGLPRGEEIFITFLQWNGLALGVFSIVWLKFDSWLDGRPGHQATRWNPLNVQMAMTVANALVLPIWCVTALVISPGRLPESMGALSDPLSYATLGLAVIAAALRYRAQATRWGLAWFSLTALAATALAAASTAPANTPENWISYHLLMSGWTLVAALATVACLVPERLHGFLAHSLRLPADEVLLATPAGVRRITDSAAQCATLVGAAVLALASRGVVTDPARPYWGSATIGILTVLAAIIALKRRSQRFAYTSARLAALAASYAWSSPWLGIGLTPTVQSWVELAQATAIAAVLAGGFWLAIELVSLRKRGAPFDAHFTFPPVHRAAARLALLLTGGLTIAGLMIRGFMPDGFPTGHPDISNPGGGLLILSLAALLVGSLWDPRAVRSLPGLYALGLAATGVAIDMWEPVGRDVVHFTGRGLAAFAFVTSAAWVMRHHAVAQASRLRIPNPDVMPARLEFWLPAATALLAEITALIGGWAVLTYDESSWRMIAAGSCAVTAICLPAFAQNQRAPRFRELTLFFVAVAAVEFGWAAIPLDAGTNFWLERTVRLLVVLCGATIGYSIVCKRVLSAESDWFAPFRRLATFLGGGSLLTLAIVLGQEAWLFDPIEGAPLAPIQIALVAIVLVGLTAALISLALLPGRDPLELSERRRMAYVYTAEVVLALLFLHIYLTMPELFQGYLLPYWPFIVMGISFFGAGAGELFHRAKLRVLSEPLHNTGAFLPLLPALGFWIHTSRSEYSTVLFVVGLLYVVLSMWRPSYLYGFAAALAGNAGLWSLWHEQGIALTEHPQLWLIPPALCVLAAAHYNRDRLTGRQLTAIRYLCISTIYVSSTGDMFIAGVGRSLAMPMILAGLSVAGAFAGIALRVRAFLYLGLSFLLLSLVSMVAHAARNINHVWPWWAFGIALGLAILTLLGVFEKKRNEVLATLEKLRQWEA